MKLAAFLLCAVVFPFGAQAAHTPAPAAKAAFDRAVALDKEKKGKEALAAYIEAVEADPAYIAPHDALLEFRHQWARAAYENKDLKSQSDEINSTLEAKYAEWEKKYPAAVGVLYGIGSQLNGKEDPKAKTYLLKVVEQDPTIAKVFYMLAFDAERWGNEKAGSEYMHKASLLEPQNPDYAFYYASGLQEVDPSKWEAASRDVAKRFPTSERGAQALYWLGARSKADSKRIAVWEQLRTQFPPEKFSWSANAMSGLFEAYLRTDPPKAVTFAQEMQGGKEAKEWAGRQALAQSYVEANTLIAAGKAGEAASLLDKLTPDRYSTNAAMLTRLKAQVMASAGRQQEAYDSLLQRQSKTPDDETLAAMVRIGQPLNKTKAQVDADIRAALDAAAKPAPAFDLGLYSSDKTLSLESLRGKVVFLTFWFPGCGPCRGEFPHFETVVRQFKDNKDLVYLGINGIRDQDDYVLPFMQGTDYSFIPLKGTEAVTGPDGYKVRGYPSNFLIDRQGRIAYSGFRTSDDEASQRTLARMIESLL